MRKMKLTSCHCCLLCICRPKGSDCGIVNVNIPTSGAEIGGAFGTPLGFLSYKNKFSDNNNFCYLLAMLLRRVGNKVDHLCCVFLCIVNL